MNAKHLPTKPAMPLPELFVGAVNDSPHAIRALLHTVVSDVAFCDTPDRARGIVHACNNFPRLEKELADMTAAYDTAVSQTRVQMKAISKFVDERAELVAALRQVLGWADVRLDPIAERQIVQARALLAKLGEDK